MIFTLQKTSNKSRGHHQQVWLLSGGDHDPSDVPTNTPFFQNLLAKFNTPASDLPDPFQVSFSLPALAIEIHANHVLRALELPEMFQSHVTDLITPRPGDFSGVEVFSRSRMGEGLTTHAVFEGSRQHRGSHRHLSAQSATPTFCRSRTIRSKSWVAIGSANRRLPCGRRPIGDGSWMPGCRATTRSISSDPSVTRIATSRTRSSGWHDSRLTLVTDARCHRIIIYWTMRRKNAVGLQKVFW